MSDELYVSCDPEQEHPQVHCSKLMYSGTWTVVVDRGHVTLRVSIVASAGLAMLSRSKDTTSGRPFSCGSTEEVHKGCHHVRWSGVYLQLEEVIVILM